MVGKDSDNTLRILLTSDNHVGYMEKDGMRGNDTFRTLEEILCLGRLHKVDFILQSGDLFHEVRPSISCLNEVLRLLRTYCLDESPVMFEMLSDPTVTFANTAHPGVNYLDGNLNIGIPIFAIHGNHDDPSGIGNVCPPDLLHTCGFINLFGKYNCVEELKVSPLLLRKGSTHLAIYGIGAIREERLHRLFRDNKVTFLRPDHGEWFSIAVIHQNRVRHGPTGYLPENYLPSFLDLVIWGHEHSCRLEPEWNATGSFYVIQPGSSVVTSLSEGEAVEKCVGLLEVRGMEFKLAKLPLRSVRRFVFGDLVLEDELSEVDANAPDASLRVEQICTARVQAAIDKAAKVTTDSRQLECALKMEEGATELATFKQPPEPLIRLRVDTSGGFERFSALRFGQRFVGRVANPKDLIAFTTKRDNAACRGASNTTATLLQSGTGINSVLGRGGFSVNDVEFFISRYFASNSELHLALLNEVEMAAALRQFVIDADGEAIHTTVERTLAQIRDHLFEVRCSEEEISMEVARFANCRKEVETAANATYGDKGTSIHENSSAPPTDTNSPRKKSTEDERSETAVSTRRRLKQGTISFVISSSDESQDESEDQLVLQVTEELSENSEGTRCAGSNWSTANAGSISRKQPAATRGRGGKRGTLGNKVSQRDFGRTRRATAAISKISDTNTTCIASEESNEPFDISFSFRRKRGRRG